ncbi:MAG TPA: ornithine cyclodeaminase family protein [Candidatus Limnocylindria bacterium]|jgi:ornithine cyclodeaminase|nr:ornithine cyclodeaminase family protein [Candidatus Limnocylindria bacterium]
MQPPRSMLVIDGATAQDLLPMDRCIDLMADALAGLARGEAANPLRTVVPVPAEVPSALAAMPAVLADPPAMGVKVISIFPGNHGSGIESHQGFVLLFEGERGSPVALIDAIAITAIRTAAVSGLATRLLAREDAGDLAILGSGTQARSHLAAMRAARPLRRVRAWSPHRERLEAFAREAADDGTPVEPTASAQAAVEGADIICTVTASATPVVEGAWLAPGAHLNAVGSSLPTNRELDSDAVARSRLFVDRRESARNEAGDFLIPLQEGAIGQDHIVAEIGEIAAGLAEGRRSADEITLFKSLGLAIEDLAAARWIHQQAVASGAGTPIPLG